MKMFIPRNYRSRIMKLNLALLLGTALISGQVEAKEKVFVYKISEQNLASALANYALVSDLEVLSSPELLKGKTSHDLTGRFDFEQALKILLQDSGLTYKIQNDRTILIYPDKNASAKDLSGRKLASAEPDPSLYGARYQDTESAAGSDGARDVQARTLEEVVVTARKRSESLQRVPVAVTAFSSSDLAANVITSTSDLAKFTPGLQYSSGSQGGSSAQFFIRGIGQIDFIATNDPGVGVYVDGVYMARTTGSNIDFLNVGRVEVLRGPQGTLFGKNTIGGAINVVMADPGEDFAGIGEMRYGSRDRLDVRLGADLPLVENKLLTNISVVSKNQDGYGTRLLDGKKTGNTDVTAARATAMLLVSENFTAKLSADYSHVDQEENHSVLLEANPDGFIAGMNNAFCSVNGCDLFDSRFVPSSIFQTWNGIRPGNKLDVWGGTLTLNGTIGSVDIKSITAYREMDSFTGADFDGSPLTLGDQTVDTTQDQFSQELQISGTGLDGKLKWVSGLFYMHEDVASEIFILFSNPADPNGLDVRQFNDIKTNSYAAYGQATYQLTDKLGITGGIRYTDEKKNHTFQHTATKFNFDIVPLSNEAKSWSSVSPRASLDYQVTDDILTYVSASRGFKSGGFNGRLFNPNDQSEFAPETVWAYEAGFKADFLNRRLRTNVAAFYSDYSDIQATVTVETPDGPANIVTNAAKAKIKGIEAEVTALPVSDLKFNLGLTILDTKFSNVDPGSSIMEGAKLPRAPEFTATVGAEYSVPVADFGELVFAANYFHTGSFFHNATNTSIDHEPAYDLVDAKMTLRPSDQSWELAAYVLNLTDEKYFQYKEDLLAFGYAEGFPGRPREWGIEARVNF